MATFQSNPTMTHTTPRPVRKGERIEEAIAVAAAVLTAMDENRPRENAWSQAGRRALMQSRLQAGRKS